MTRDEFLTRLRACAGQYRWSLDDGRLRASVPSAAAETDEPSCCPITLVCWHEQGEYYDEIEWDGAADALALEEPDEILHAADNDGLGIESLRQALLAAVGLEATSP